MSDALVTEKLLLSETVENSNKNNTLDIFKGPRMTKKFLKNHCKENRLYQTPYLNDVLYLHFKGFSFIENLEEYTGLKCLWLENNGLKEISGLDHQQGLRSLFLHYNLIKKIENLENCLILDTLNLSHNQVKTIENLDCLKSLHTLNIANNYVESLEDFEHLEKLLELSVLDLANNHIDNPLIVKTLGRMPGLRVLNLMGNPVIRKIPAYRKTLILACAHLQYLDDRPVFPRERACAEAWQRGGITEEHDERKRWIDRERQKIMDSVNALIKMKDAKRAVRDNTQILDSGFCTSVGDSESEPESLSHPKLDNFNRNSAMDNGPDNEEPFLDKERKVIYGRDVAVEEDGSGGDETSSASSDTDSDGDFMMDRQTIENHSNSRSRIFDFSSKAPFHNQKRLVEELEPRPCTSKQAIAETESIDADEETKVTTRENLKAVLTTNLDIAKGDFNTSLPETTSSGSVNEGRIKTQVLEDQGALAIESVENLMDKPEASNGSQPEINKFEDLENLIYQEVQTGRVDDESVDNIERSEELKLNANTLEEDVNVIKKKHVDQIEEASALLSEPSPLKPKTFFTIYRDQNLEDGSEDSDDSEAEESDSSNKEDEEKVSIKRQSAFASIVDKCEAIKMSSMEVQEGDFTISVKAEKELPVCLLREDSKCKELNDVSYRQLLNLNIKIPNQNRMTLQLADCKRNKEEDECKSGIGEMLLQSKKESKPESEIVSPKDISEEEDKALCDQNDTVSICYDITYSERDIVVSDAKHPMIYNVLKFSKNRQEHENTDRVMSELQQDEEEIIKVDNSVVVNNTIGDVREGMWEINKKFEEFQEKNRCARQDIIDNYNEALEKEIKIIDEFIELQKDRPKRIFLSKPLRKPEEEINDKYLKKHFNDMGMYLPEDVEKQGLIFQRGDVVNSVEESTVAEIVDSQAERQLLAEMETLRKVIEGEERETKKSDLDKKKELIKTEREKIIEEHFLEDIRLEDDADDALMEETATICSVKRNVSRSLEMQLAQERNKIEK
ncbi:dynein axonemal assembly factor 1 homolog [Euwallacea similis]|uniref:dynein axonemal assembly factor 1 homolog n=1 Tax=Euwallacea similis TaxID=1736056 RepID=UPI00344CF4AE